MDHGLKIARVAALVGDPARATMLAALLDGRALTASELARVAGVAPQTASGHLAKLVEGTLLSLEKQGRHRYFRLASPMVGRMLEGLMVMAPVEQGVTRWRGGDALRHARSCYDHMAGRLAVALADALVERGHVVLGDDGGAVTAAGRAFLDGLVGADLAAGAGRRVFCRPCLDWSERRLHLAGAVGAVLLRHVLARDWVRRVDASRALAVSPAGQRAFVEIFGIPRDLARGT